MNKFAFVDRGRPNRESLIKFLPILREYVETLTGEEKIIMTMRLENQRLNKIASTLRRSRQHVLNVQKRVCRKIIRKFKLEELGFE